MRTVQDEDVQVVSDGAALDAHLTVPFDAAGVIVFAHGSGSSRSSTRNAAVALVLNDAGFGTLLLDLQTPAEQQAGSDAFPVELLARRLRDARRWLAEQPSCSRLPVGLFGASTGAAAALWAAAEPGSDIAAVVSRGGRPDLAAERLPAVTAPTLLIVGGRDELVLGLNRQAQASLRVETGLAVVPGAGHLFEEPGALDAVAMLAIDWFADHVSVQAPAFTAAPR
jgi:putative phosphoribosyl transferase